MSALALAGGAAVRSKPFPPHPIIGDEEKQAVLDVLNCGELSTFIAVQGEYFNGGQKIKEFERRFADYHSVRFAVAFNSATAALHAAVVAVGVEPGEEVIVPAYTFTSTATCVLMHNAIPVFADVDDEVFGLDADSIRQVFSPLTRAIIPVHLFGHPADMGPIVEFARAHGLRVIEDCAQAPGASYLGKRVGTIGDCGIFSFTENKNITTGEGGMLLTDDAQIADVARLVRNHGEIILEGQAERTYNSTILGWNYRMTEMEAALGIIQFGRMDELNDRRIALAEYLSMRIEGIDGLVLPVVRAGSRHVFYIFAMRYVEKRLGMPRSLFVDALRAEGIPVGAGYVRPLYLSGLYHKNRPFAFVHYGGSARYDEGICPTIERLHSSELVTLAMVRPPATFKDMDDVAEAILKVVNGRDELVALVQG